MPSPRSFQLLAVGSAVTAFALVLLGAVVRITESGMGCPDWPLCFGRWLPPWDRAAILEWLHRDLAALVSLATVAIGVVAVLGPFTLAVRLTHQLGAACLFVATRLALDAALDADPPRPA